MKKFIASSFVIIVIFTLASGSSWWQREIKSWQSNYGGGLNRKMIVYSESGEVLAEYEGKFDIEYDNNRIKFIQDGKMRNIYLGNSATVIVEEK